MKQPTLETYRRAGVVVGYMIEDDSGSHWGATKDEALSAANLARAAKGRPLLKRTGTMIDLEELDQ